MKIIDISASIYEGMAVYEGDPPFRKEFMSRWEPGNPASFQTSLLHMGTHVGTHVDAPRHFHDDAPGIDEVSLEILCGRARVYDVRGRGFRIDSQVLRSLDLKGVKRVVFRTDSEGSSRLSFDPNYAHFTEDAAFLLLDMGIELVGIDSPSIEAYDHPGMPVHHAFLDHEPGIIIVEGLDLSQVQAGDYELICLPLKLLAADGAPARAVLLCHEEYGSRCHA
jgi:arylformamidase